MFIILTLHLYCLDNVFLNLSTFYRVTQKTTTQSNIRRLIEEAFVRDLGKLETTQLNGKSFK